MPKHGSASLGQLAELTALIVRALPKAIKGLDMKALLRATNNNGEQLSKLLEGVFVTLANPFPNASVSEVLVEVVPAEWLYTSIAHASFQEMDDAFREEHQNFPDYPVSEEYEAAFVVLSMGDTYSWDQAIEEIRRRDLVPANLPELVSFACAISFEDMGSPIAAIAEPTCWVDSEGVMRRPYIVRGSGDTRCLRLTGQSPMYNRRVRLLCRQRL